MKVNNIFITLVIGTVTMGTCSAETYEDTTEAFAALQDIKKNGRQAISLDEIRSNNAAGISFNDNEPINVSIAFEDEDCSDISDEDIKKLFPSLPENFQEQLSI